MPTPEESKCPRCARADTTQISGRPTYRGFDTLKRHPVGMLYVFKCQCGAAFTVEVRGPEPNYHGPTRMAADSFLSFVP
jgi:hypothetical protein